MFGSSIAARTRSCNSMEDGRLLRSWGGGIINSSHGIAVGPDGGIWAVDVGAHMVLKFSPEGRVQIVLGHVGGQAGTNDDKYAFNKPTGVAFDSTGNVYVFGRLREYARRQVQC